MLPPRYSSSRSLTVQYPASVADTWPHEIAYQIITSVYRGRALRHGPHHMLDKTCREKAQLGCDPTRPDSRPEYRTALTDSCYAALRNPGALCSRLLQNATTQEVKPACTFWVGLCSGSGCGIGDEARQTVREAEAGGWEGGWGPVGWCSLAPPHSTPPSALSSTCPGAQGQDTEKAPEASLAHVCPFRLTSSSTSKFHEDVLKASFTLTLYFSISDTHLRRWEGRDARQHWARPADSNLSARQH